MGPVGMQELLIIVCIIAFLFGINKLPKIGRGLGEGIREFKNSLKELRGASDEVKRDL